MKNFVKTLNSRKYKTWKKWPPFANRNKLIISYSVYSYIYIGFDLHFDDYDDDDDDDDDDSE